MAAQAPKPDEERGRILRFEPRRSASRPAAPPPDVAPVTDLKQFARRDDDKEDYRHRMATNAAALVVVVALIWCGYWLFDSLADLRRKQDCALRGGLQCTTIKIPSETR